MHNLEETIAQKESEINEIRENHACTIKDLKQVGRIVIGKCLFFFYIFVFQLPCYELSSSVDITLLQMLSFIVIPTLSTYYLFFFFTTQASYRNNARH